MKGLHVILTVIAIIGGTVLVVDLYLVEIVLLKLVNKGW